MIKKLSSLTLLLFILLSYTMPLTFNCGIDNYATRSTCDFDVIYIDDEAIALADSSGDSTALRSEALRAYNLVNETRADEGLDTLTWDQGLESTSAVRAEECSSSFSHTRPNGSPWYSVNSQIMGGENLAFGFDDAGSAVDAWMDSPTHRDNVLYPDFTKIAISVYVADDGTHYWAQEFGY